MLRGLVEDNILLFKVEEEPRTIGKSSKMVGNAAASLLPRGRYLWWRWQAGFDFENNGTGRSDAITHIVLDSVGLRHGVKLVECA